jgi:hypothetical protein
MRAMGLLVLATLAFGVLGCARKVVLDPALVPSFNDKARTIQRAPKPAPEVRAAPRGETPMRSPPAVPRSAPPSR